MTEAQFDAWADRSITGFAAEQVTSGLLPPAEAAAHARGAFDQLLPDRLATPHHHFWTVWADDVEVGHLWVRVRTLADEVEGYVYDVELVPEARGRGLGGATMAAAEQAARDLDATVMRLNVFGHNTPAMRLYDRAGYVVADATWTCRTDEPDHLPPDGLDVALHEMPTDRFSEVRTRLPSVLGDACAAARVLPAEEARRRAASDVDLLLGTGPHSPGQWLFTASHGGLQVADGWLDVQQRSDGRHAAVRWFEVREGLRGNGYGRAVARAVLAECRCRRVGSVSVSVLGSRSPATRVLDELGFRLTARTMVKELAPAPR
jgi:ribosomal protein S18 acetylase RimI-like enzyme